MVYVETDFLIALAKDSDWLKENAEDALQDEDTDVSTSILAYAEFLLLTEKYGIDRVRAVSNLLEMVPVVPRGSLTGGSEGGEISGGTRYDNLRRSACRFGRDPRQAYPVFGEGLRLS
jgi:hypothetical protein